MVRIISLILVILMIVLFPPAALAYISQDAIPGDSTYPIKRTLEKGILFLSAITPQTKALFSVSASKTRTREIKKLLNKGDNAYDTLKELIAQNDVALQEIRLVSNAKQQQEYLASLADTLKQNNQELTSSYNKLKPKSSSSQTQTSNSNTKTQANQPSRTTQIIQITQVSQAPNSTSPDPQLLSYIEQLQAQQKIIAQQQKLLDSQIKNGQTTTQTHAANNQTPKPNQQTPAQTIVPKPPTQGSSGTSNPTSSPTAAPVAFLDLALGWITIPFNKPSATSPPQVVSGPSKSGLAAGTSALESPTSPNPTAPSFANADLAAPSGLRVICQGNGTAALTWLPVSAAAGYFLIINKEPFDDWYNLSGGDFNLAGSNLGFTFPYDPGKNYQWTVEPYVSGETIPLNNNFSSGPDFKCPTT